MTNSHPLPTMQQRRLLQEVIPQTSSLVLAAQIHNEKSSYCGKIITWWIFTSLLFSFLFLHEDTGRPPSSGLAGCETMSLPLGSRCRTCVRACARVRMQEAPWLWSVPRSRWLTPETPAPPGGPPSKYQRHTGRPRRTWHAHKRGPPRCALGAQTHMLFVYSCECAPIHTRKSKQRP